MEHEIIFSELSNACCHFHSMPMEINTVCRGFHFHTEVEIVFVKSGAILCLLENDRCIQIPSGHFLIIGGGVIHRLAFDHCPSKIAYLQMDALGVLQKLYPDTPLSPLACTKTIHGTHLVSPSDTLAPLCRVLFEELEEKRTHFEVAVTGCLVQLIAHLQRQGFMGDPWEVTDAKLYQKILPALSHANEHFAEKIRLEDICRIVGVNKYHFCKLFKKSTGVTFFEHLNAVRLKNAEKKLILTNQTITEIALECGFSTVQYFNAAFVKMKGCSPSAFRKMIR